MNLFDFQWHHRDAVHLLWLAGGFVVLFGWLKLRNNEALGRFLSAVMQHRLAHRQSRQRRIFHLVLVAIALVAGVFAVMGPYTKGHPETVSKTRLQADIVIALDLSKSMLAEDAAPNRLARARAEISGLLNQMPGQRVGLVGFAGRATVLCPLTPDYSFFRMILRDAGPDSVTRGGTAIGDAIRTAIGAFGDQPGARLLLLITDGEDHDSYPLDAAKQALDASVRIITIGFGSEKGSKITLVDPDTGARKTLTDSAGNEVVSKLDGDLLRQIAKTTEGAYVPAGVAALDLKSIVEQHILPMAREQTVTSRQLRPNEHYPWFVLASLCAMFGAVWLGATNGRRNQL